MVKVGVVIGVTLGLGVKIGFGFKVGLDVSEWVWFVGAIGFSGDKTGLFNWDLLIEDNNDPWVIGVLLVSTPVLFKREMVGVYIFSGLKAGDFKIILEPVLKILEDEFAPLYNKEASALLPSEIIIEAPKTVIPDNPKSIILFKLL